MQEYRAGLPIISLDDVTGILPELACRLKCYLKVYISGTY